MYLVSLYENDGVVEASLGGRVTADEIRVFGEELLEMVADLDGRPWSLLMDHSKAKRLDSEAMGALAEVKDLCLKSGAARILSVPIDEEDMFAHENCRLQYVLEGTESFSMGATLSALPKFPAQQEERRAA